MTSYTIIQQPANKTLAIRRILRGATPVKLDRSFCEVQSKLREISEFIGGLPAPTPYAEDMKWAIQNAIIASSANMMFSRLRKNDQDVFRNVGDKTKLLVQLCEILGLEEDLV